MTPQIGTPRVWRIHVATADIAATEPGPANVGTVRRFTPDFIRAEWNADDDGPLRLSSVAVSGRGIRADGSRGRHRGKSVWQSSDLATAPDWVRDFVRTHAPKEAA